MNADELDRRARAARYIARLRAELVELGADEERVKRLSIEGLLHEKQRQLDRLMGAPTP